jgi:hypothetical protein
MNNEVHFVGYLNIMAHTISAERKVHGRNRSNKKK